MVSRRRPCDSLGVLAGRAPLYILLATGICGCSGQAPVVPDGGGGRDAVVELDAQPALDGGLRRDAGSTDGGQEPDAGACEPGAFDCPVAIEQFPFTHSGDTSLAEPGRTDAYTCAPSINESGPEVYYRMQLAEPGIFTASIDDVPGDAVDIDLHLLNVEGCLMRANAEMRRWLPAGTYNLVLDTWVSQQGEVRSGAYELSIDFEPLEAGVCAMMPTDVRMFWRSCDSSVNCFERDGERYLSTPTTGPVVKEAHLVTVDDDFGGGWPSSFTDQIRRHYTVSESVTGYQGSRSEPWAPAGEGGSEYGQGATAAPLPVLDEAWYINMYWRDRPARGTRMLVRHPQNGRTVVTSAGYETGPGSNTAVAGVAEEVHLYLGTGHRDELEIGFAVDQGLPLGPIECP